MTGKTAAEELANISKKTATEQLTLQHMIELREAFETADKDKEGSLSIDEVGIGLREVVCRGLRWDPWKRDEREATAAAIYEDRRKRRWHSRLG